MVINTIHVRAAIDAYFEGAPSPIYGEHCTTLSTAGLLCFWTVQRNQFEPESGGDCRSIHIHKMVLISVFNISKRMPTTSQGFSQHSAPIAVLQPNQ